MACTLSAAAADAGEGRPVAAGHGAQRSRQDICAACHCRPLVHWLRIHYQVQLACMAFYPQQIKPDVICCVSVVPAAHEQQSAAGHSNACRWMLLMPYPLCTPAQECVTV